MTLLYTKLLGISRGIYWATRIWDLRTYKVEGADFQTTVNRVIAVVVRQTFIVYRLVTSYCLEDGQLSEDYNGPIGIKIGLEISPKCTKTWPALKNFILTYRHMKRVTPRWRHLLSEHTMRRLRRDVNYIGKYHRTRAGQPAPSHLIGPTPAQLISTSIHPCIDCSQLQVKRATQTFNLYIIQFSNIYLIFCFLLRTFHGYDVVPLSSGTQKISL